ncbi:MAG: glycosyltransferase family 39 protein [Chloroflexi bacterium]|nr:glycosyltransferase family 39 protein [Chloroflexota bacterium]
MRIRRLSLWLAALFLAITVLGIVFRQPLWHTVKPIIGYEVRDRIIAVYSRLTARQVETADYEPMPYTGFNPYGINVFLEQEVQESEIRRTLQMIKEAGFGWIKQQVLWYEIERPAKGLYQDDRHNNVDTWKKYDRIVDLADEYGLGLILRIDTSPEWARPGKSKLETPPDNFDDFGDFVYTIVSRYKGKVRYYQIWNEPNLAFEWGGQVPNAKEYVRLLKIAYVRAKEADPKAVILAAALAPTIEYSERGINDLIFLQQMYDAGAKPYFDIMSVNPYGLRSGPDDYRIDEQRDINFSRPILTREIMVRNGDAGKPIWGSEMGWCALPPDFPAEPLFGRVTREQQAEYTVRAYQRIQEEWPWMGVVNLWHFRAVNEADKEQQRYYFNIVGSDFHPHPVYKALKELATGPRVMYLGYHQEDHWALNFDGHWQRATDHRAGLGHYAFSDTAGDAVRFLFKGNELDLVVRKGPTAGRLLVTIDGSSEGANLLPRDEQKRAYLDLYNPEVRWQERVPVADGLSDDVHFTELRVAATTNESSSGKRCVLDGIVVIKGSNNLPLIGSLIGMGVGLVLLGGLAWSQRWRREHTTVTPESAPRSPQQISLLLALLLIVACGFALRIYLLNGQSLEYDEGVTAALMTRDLSAITQAAAMDIHPPLYYYLLRIWTIFFGTSEFVLRLFSAVIGVALLPLLAKVGTRLMGWGVGLVAAWLAAVAPLLIYYSQEARMYSLLLLLSTLSMYLFIRLILERSDGEEGRTHLWLSYVIVATLSLYTHYLAVAVLLVQNVYVLVVLSRRDRRLRSWLKSQLVIVLLCLPWLLYVGRQVIGRGGPGVGEYVAFGSVLRRAFVVFSFGLSADATLTNKAAAVFLFFLLAGCFWPLARYLRDLSWGICEVNTLGRRFAEDLRPQALMAFWCLVPIVVTYALWLWHPLYNPIDNPRLLILAVPAYYLWLAIGINSFAFSLPMVLSPICGFIRCKVKENFQQIAIITGLGSLILCLALVGFFTSRSLLAYYYDPKYARDDYRGLVQQIESSFREEDAIVLNAPGQVEIFRYYYRGEGDVYPLPRQRPIDERDTEGELWRIAGGHKRVWLVLWAVQEADPNGFIEGWLDKHGHLIRERLFGTVRLLLYEVS